MPNWPTGVETVSIVFGKGITPDGINLAATLEVIALFNGTKAVIWEDDGTPMLPVVARAAVEAGALGSVRIPVTDQAGWLDDGQNAYQGWSYRLIETSGGITRSKVFQPVSGQDVIDFDRIPDGSVGLPGSSPVPAVTSVVGLTGTVTGPQLAAALDRFIADPAEVAGVPLFARGTSFTNGASASPGAGFVDLVAAALDASAVHNAGSGGSNTPNLPYQYVDSGAKWVPGTSQGLVLIEAGIGEALSEIGGREKQFRRVFEAQMYAALRWHRATAMYRPDHDAFELGAGAALESLAISGVALAPGIKLNADGEQFTFTVPPGHTEAVLNFTPWRQSAEAENGDYLVTVNGTTRKGTTKGMGDPRNDGESVLLTLVSERVTGLSGGDVITVEQDGPGTVWFHSALTMGNTNPPPIILVQGVPVPDADAAALEVYRSIVSRVAAAPEFGDGRVVVADPASMFVPASDTAGDDIHPNDSGHAVYARAILFAAQSL